MGLEQHKNEATRDFTQRWLAGAAPAQLEARNRRETDAFATLVAAHQQLLFRGLGLGAGLAMSASFGRASAAGGGDNGGVDAALLQQQQLDAVAAKHLATIQQLERELSAKNAELARVTGRQLQLVSESKELLQAQEQWELQLQRFTQRLQEEMLLGEEKDRALAELDTALRLAHDELARHRALLERSEHEAAGLRERVVQLEAQLAEMQTPAAVAERTRAAMATQELAESTSRLVVDVGGMRNGDTTKPPTRVAHTVRAHATEVNSVSFNTSGKILFSGSSDGTVRAWEATSCRPLGEYRGVGTAHPLLCVRGSEDGEFVLGTGCDRKCFVWRVGTGRVHQTLVGHKGKVLAGEFSRVAPGEVVTGSSDRSMRVWDVARGRSVQTINCQSSCNDLAMALGGQFASAHQDGVVRFWDTRTKAAIAEMKGLHEDQCTSVSFSASGEQLLTNSRDHSLRLVDPRMYAAVATLRHPGYHCGFDWCKASLSPDGALAVAGGASGTLFVWNARSGKLEKEHRMGHQGAIACCVWRPDGSSAASCDKNGFLVLWE